LKSLKQTSKLPLDVKSPNIEDMKHSLDMLVDNYVSMEKNQTDAINFLREHLLVDATTFLAATKDGVYNGEIPDLIASLETKFDWKENKLGRALFLWTQTVLGAFNQVLEQSEVVGSPLDANLLDTRVQAKLAPLLSEFDDRFKKKVPLNPKPKEVAAGGYASEVCGRITEAFRRDSVATRLLLEALLVAPPKA
jgi:hypothetical protein